MQSRFTHYETDLFAGHLRRARASRVNFGASAKFFSFNKKVVGEAPTTAREARALPGTLAARYQFNVTLLNNL